MRFLKKFIVLLITIVLFSCAGNNQAWESKLNDLVDELTIQKEYIISYLDGHDGAFLKVEESFQRSEKLSRELSDAIDSDEEAAIVIEKFREKIQKLKPKQEIIKEKGRQNIDRIKNIAILEKKYKSHFE